MNQDTTPPDRDSKPEEASGPPSGANDGGTDASGIASGEEPRPAAGRPEALGPEAPPPPGGARWEEPRPGSSAPPRSGHRIEYNVKRKSTWLRLVFIIFFAILYWIAEIVLTAVIVIQFLWVLVNGEPNEKLRGFGQSLARYAYQVFRYMTFNSDERPFPIDLDWPPSDRV